MEGSVAVGAIQQCPAIRLELESTPDAASIVRGALSALAEQIDFDPELLDDLKTAVTEACNNVVMHAYGGSAGRLSVYAYVDRDSVEVVVRDYGEGIAHDVGDEEQERGVGIPIIRALTRDAEFSECDDGGTEVRMDFAARQGGRRLVLRPPVAAPEDDWVGELSGDAVVSLSPVSLVSGVLGRVARALAARARFSLDRFFDVYLATDAIAVHAVNAASGSRIGFGLSFDTRHLEMTIGPFRRGASAGLSGRAEGLAMSSALSLLADELEVVTANNVEILRVVIDDRTRPVARAM